MCDNWDNLVNEYDPLIGREYKGGDGKIYTFFGLVHSDDDYYYGMVHGVKLRLLSCVGSPEGMGFELLPMLPVQ